MKIFSLLLSLFGLQFIPHPQPVIKEEKRVVPVKVEIAFRELEIDTVREIAEVVVTRELVKTLVRDGVIKTEVIDDTRMTGTILVKGLVNIVL